MGLEDLQGRLIDEVKKNSFKYTIQNTPDLWNKLSVFLRKIFGDDCNIEELYKQIYISNLEFNYYYEGKIAYNIDFCHPEYSNIWTITLEDDFGNNGEMRNFFQNKTLSSNDNGLKGLLKTFLKKREDSEIPEGDFEFKIFKGQNIIHVTFHNGKFFEIDMKIFEDFLKENNVAIHPAVLKNFTSDEIGNILIA